jgi:hypothetical protein
MLLIDGRDRTKLVEQVEHQVDIVRSELSHFGQSEIDVRGALCIPDVNGLPLFRTLSVRSIIVDGPKPVAKLARRPGQLSSDATDQIFRHLAAILPPA